MTATTTATMPAPPTKMAGHYVLAAKPVVQRDGEHPNCVVLAYDPNDFQAFVTWVAYLPEGSDRWEACWGHYFGDVVRAVADYTERT